DHPLYASGRKYAAYRWRKPASDQGASNPVQPKVTRYEKEETAPSVDSAPRIGLSPRSRLADRKSLRTRPANHQLKARPKIVREENDSGSSPHSPRYWAMGTLVGHAAQPRLCRTRCLSQDRGCRKNAPDQTGL